VADDIYESKSPGYQIIVQGAEPIYAPGTGTQIGRWKELVAEFGTFGPEIERVDPVTGDQIPDAYSGVPLKTAIIYGGVFDLQEQAARKGWTDEETELVRQKVEYQCQLTPTMVWKRSAVKIAAPWPTYEQAHHKQIPALAEQLGLVGEALAYENQREKPRAEVVAKLEEILAGKAAEEELTAA
jgi:hypothetical protein